MRAQGPNAQCSSALQLVAISHENAHNMLHSLNLLDLRHRDSNRGPSDPEVDDLPMIRHTSEL